jgi:hypothetical protein
MVTLVGTMPFLGSLMLLWTLELQLMIEKPDIYLQDPGMSNLASAGFKMNDSLFMRDGEYAPSSVHIKD